LDRADPIAWARDRFVVDDEACIYLDGNSLGRLPKATLDAVREAMRAGWGGRLVRVWEEWIDIPRRIGDLVGEHILGAAPGQVLVCDSTSINLYKLASAALDARPDRHVVLTSADNFPTDRYVLEGLCTARGLELRLPESTAAAREALDRDVALVSLSHVAYGSGAIEDVPAITAAAHEAGALALWDLCHSAGAVPIELDRWDVDLAVACSYKYLNAGPGAPALLYVRRSLQESLRQPIWGWFGQRDQFAMGPAYDPDPSIGRFQVGTPPIVAMLPIEVGAGILAEAGIGRLRAKSMALTELLVALWDAWLQPRGFALASPRDPERRGGHVVLAHPDAYRICRALVETAGVIPDFRPPNLVRLSPVPAYTRFVDVWDGMDRLRSLFDAGAHLKLDPRPARVT
jgi:kynureninase